MEKLGLVVLSLIVRLFFWVYRALSVALLVSLVVGWIFYLARAHFPCGESGAYWWWPIAALTAVLLFLTRRQAPAKDNPYRRYAGAFVWMDQCADSLVAWIGTIKYFTSPISLVEDPGSYKIKGDEIRALLDDVLQPGDILLRGFDGYLDGIMIGLSGGGQGLGKYFSHAALFLGDLHDDPDKPIVARRLQVMDDKGQWVAATAAQQDAVRNDPGYYQPGRQKVVHSMTKGVFTEDILTFVRCDYLVVLRLPDNIQLSATDLKTDHSLIRDLPPDAQAIHQKLLAGQSVDKGDIINVIHRSALGKIGSCYDFQFNDGKTHHRFSCSEFVYYCYKSIHCYLGLKLKMHAFLKFFFARKSITPSDIYEAAVKQGKLKVAWTSRSLRQK
jgi:hypothetical protein